MIKTWGWVGGAGAERTEQITEVTHGTEKKLNYIFLKIQKITDPVTGATG